MSIRRVAIYSLVLFSILIAVISLLTYYAAFKENLRNERPFYELYVSPGETDIAMGIKMDSLLCDTTSFIQLSRLMNFTKFKPGRYVFKQGMNNFRIINKLKRGAQDPVNVTINNVRDIYQLSSKLGSELLLDSIDFVNILSDTQVLNKINYNSENILCLFIPDTYQMYWTISPERFIQRMIQENASFWNRDLRNTKALDKGFSNNDIYILASIVEKETIQEEEKALIAGVYINRLHSGMKLQADPTVVFALNLKGIQRVLLEHLKVDSPYNTYVVDGLPPGPICMPSVSTIDSVLNSVKHDYLFFCAKPGYDGGHAFAKTLEGHYQNARVYRQWLDKERIR